jgi:hypothetical protein
MLDRFMLEVKDGFATDEGRGDRTGDEQPRFRIAGGRAQDGYPNEKV